MMRNGSYSAWFRTPRGEGTGIVVLDDGNLTGGDSVSAYTGAYVVEGNKFTASIAARRRTQGPSVFGIDNVDLTVTGKFTPTMASCTGTAKQAPDVTFEAVLIPIADEPNNAAPQASRRWKRATLRDGKRA
ncbi:MAG: hypothetical protein JWP25_2779 [Bradyrhizobium sp.]|jgi:hypothetical protein|nr:hypothetical protein [Bradyrhizobium sp.]